MSESKQRKYKLSLGRVSIVEIDRETASMVWVNGRGCKKLTSWEGYFDTFEELKHHVVTEAERDAVNARAALDRANGRLGNAKGLKPPSPKTETE